MAFARGKFGVEYNTTRQRDDGSSGLGWVFAVVAMVALVSFAWTLARRFVDERNDRDVEQRIVAPAPAAPVPPAPAASNAPPPAVAGTPPPALPVTLRNRPMKAQNLLMRLEEAERRHDVEMTVSTIEQLRALPGSPVADIDDKLARRLGALNVLRLFSERNGQWVKQVTVKRGDSASRIAAENGSTLASLARLNGGNVDKVVLGSRLYVMDHPRFNLVIHRRTRIADLSLNGKFFRRYDLVGEVRGETGAYEISSNPRAVWRKIGVEFRPADRSELELLMPAGARVLVAEM